MNKVIGLDVGGTKICAVLVKDNKVLEQLVMPTPHNLYAFKHRVLSMLDKLSKGENLAVGVGVAGGVDNKTGQVKNSPNLTFLKNFAFKKFLNSKNYLKVAIDNDVACFTLAELKLGVGKKIKNFLCVTLGTGIGGGMVINKLPFRGQNNFGGEFGRMVIGTETLESSFRNFRNTKNYESMGQLLGVAFSNLINIFNPQVLILGGGVSENYKFFSKTMKKTMETHLNVYKMKTPVVVSKLKNAGALGAALLVSEK